MTKCPPPSRLIYFILTRNQVTCLSAYAAYLPRSVSISNINWAARRRNLAFSASSFDSCSAILSSEAGIVPRFNLLFGAGPASLSVRRWFIRCFGLVSAAIFIP
jgi:hypothetical protein